MRKFLFMVAAISILLFLASCGNMGPGVGPDNNMPHNPDMMDGNVSVGDKEPEEEDHADEHEHEEVPSPPANLTFNEEEARDSYSQNCARCHGANLQGGGRIPALQNVGQTHTKDDILNVIKVGPNIMPANLVTGEEAENLAKWLWTKR